MSAQRFSVWAPRAHSVELVLDGRRHVMRSMDRGWFEIEVDAGSDDSYAFALDGGDPRPDPRSQYQPHGVHAPSQTVDHHAFAWTDTG